MQTDAEQEKYKQRLDKMDELTDLILDNLLMLARSNTLTAADRKLVLDFLTKNGLELDPRSIPDDVRGLLTSSVSFDDVDASDGVLPLRAAK